MEKEEMQRCRDDVLYFCKNMMGAQLTPYQKEYLTGIDVAHKPERIAISNTEGRA